jgi:hypothetical protein
MQSLTDLNNRAATPITFTENRGTNVIFDRAAGKQYNFTETSLSFDLLVGANIVEIINPSIANVRYKVNLGTTQASLSYGTLPAGVTVNQVGTVYTFYGIDSISDWEAIKQPTVIIDPAFAGSFSYSAAVVYNTDTAADIEFEWNIGIYLPDAQLSAAASLSCAPSYFQGGIANLTSFFGLAVEGVKVLGSVFSMVTNANRLARTGATMSISSTIVAKPKLFLFTDTTFDILNPDPQEDNHEFGQTLAQDGNNTVITNIGNHPDYIGYAFNATNGNQLFAFERQKTSSNETLTNFSVDILGFNNDYVAFRERSQDGGSTDNADETISLWKKQSTGDLYTVIDTIVFTDPSGGSGGAGTSIDANNCTTTLSDGYIILQDSIFQADSTFSEYRGRVYVYSIDDSTGLTLEYTHTGVDDTTFPSNPRRQHLGNDAIAINDDYYAFTENYMYPDSVVGSWHRIFVYDTATGTLQHTINGSNSQKEPQGLMMDGNDLYITYDDRSLEVFDMSTGTTSSTITLASGGTTGLGSIRIFDSRLIYIGDTLYDRTNGNIESSPGGAALKGTFFGTTKLAIGDDDYDDTFTDEGKITIGTET